MFAWSGAGWHGALPVLAVLALTRPEAPAQVPPQEKYDKAALRVADFILSQQNEDGAIADAPDRDVCNEDSNMEYALMGVAAAYWKSGEEKYLRSLEHGIRWLAEREEMVDPEWRGSWRLAYAPKPPYAPKAISPGKGVVDARGVDATSGLFVHLLRLHCVLSRGEALAKRYEANARAALDFVLTRNRAPDGFSFSSWQQKTPGGKWRLWRYQYAADQADVYLGLSAGERLYRDKRFQEAALLIRQGIGARFFSPSLGRYGLGRDKDDSLDSDFDEFDGIFPQGYVPWVFGKSLENEVAFQWLSGRKQPDGSLSCYSGDPVYSLSVAVYALAAARLGRPAPADSLDWLLTHTYDASDGGVRDTAKAGREKYTNVAGFTVMALTGFVPSRLDEQER